MLCMDTNNVASGVVRGGGVVAKKGRGGSFEEWGGKEDVRRWSDL